MKIEEVRSKPDSELEHDLGQMTRQLFDMRFKSQTSGVQDSARIQVVRRSIARVKTVLHERATVFIEEDSWYLLVHTRCKHLRDDNLCGQYETRPQICRDYTTKNCEYEDSWVYDHYWETAEQVYEYAEAVLPLRKGYGFRSQKPAAAK